MQEMNYESKPPATSQTPASALPDRLPHVVEVTGDKWKKKMSESAAHVQKQTQLTTAVALMYILNHDKVPCIHSAACCLESCTVY
jgi:hypothetical protein